MQRCHCPAAEDVHHHAFGGCFLCPGYATCDRCRRVDERLWREELDGTKRTAPTEQARAGRDYIRRRYGNQTARVLYGRDDDMED
jgi:hypothetical protein